MRPLTTQGPTVSTLILTVLSLLVANSGLLGATNSSTHPLAGTWHSGEGLFVSIHIRFHLDGRYEADWFGCVGPNGRASGRWVLADSVVELSPTYEEHQLKGYFRRLELIGTNQLYRLVPAMDGGWQRDGAGPFVRKPETSAGATAIRRLTPRCSGHHPGVRPGGAAELIRR